MAALAGSLRASSRTRSRSASSEGPAAGAGRLAGSCLILGISGLADELLLFLGGGLGLELLVGEGPHEDLVIDQREGEPAVAHALVKDLDLVASLDLFVLPGGGDLRAHRISLRGNL